MNNTLSTWQKIKSRFFRIVLGTIPVVRDATLWVIGLWPQKSSIEARDDSRQEEARRALDEAITGLNGVTKGGAK